MKNKAIIERTVEALEARGFSSAEALQIIRRIQNGDDDIPRPLTTIDKDEIKLAYDRGFADGQRSQYGSFIRAQQQQAMQGLAAQQRAAASAYRQQYANIFRQS